MLNILLIALFGALGAVSRYGMNLVVTRWYGESFPLGILAINVLGCFLLGLIAQVSLTTDLFSPNVRNALAVGFLGAFTTFSTFSHDTFRQIESARWDHAFGNVLGHIILGLLAVYLGVALAKWMTVH